ncbi:hypothetical protein RHMOL_Rhmol01G0083200 [Rhododendron molle]|uniref:Uncharacterized protein n=1 Tax=Rhododendron molle TaxID=49168 RepID=A0ACC0Q0Q7_RHOML|nr:hypothetical protein RHMOL_Rhmol01G0083200 [Rhododendron molle]
MPEKLIYPNSKGNANQSTTEGRSPLVSGGARVLASGVRSDSTKGHVDGTDEGKSTTLVEDVVILQQGQVASREVDIWSNETKECAHLSNKEYTSPAPTDEILRGMDHALPSLGLRPICQSSNKVVESNTQYFVEEPDSPRAFPANNLDLEGDLGVYSPIPKPLSPSHPDVGHSVIFNCLLNLKRKAPDDLDLNVTLKKPNSQREEAETTLVVADSSFNQEKGRAGTRGNQRSRGRYGRGGQSVRGRKKCSPNSGVLEMELVEVPISQFNDLKGHAVVGGSRRRCASLVTLALA